MLLSSQQFQRLRTFHALRWSVRNLMNTAGNAARVAGFVCLAAMISHAASAAAPSRVPVILISIDTLRADHLSAYGYRKIATPNIDAFLEKGTKFSNISCQIPLTLPSHTSLFTSTYPSESGIEENAQHVPAGME